MEAARIPWRPLGRLLVEQGLLTADELEHALAQQEQTGRRLGETLVDCGFVSGPELSNALAAQYGIELTAETGFGTGLRTEIQRRHETDRGRILRPVPSAEEWPQPELETEQAELEASSPDEHLLHAQLEEQWAKLAAAEERLAESHRELTALAREYDDRRSQATRLAQRARDARDARGRLELDVRGCEAVINRLRGDLTHAQALASERELELDEERARSTEVGERITESHRELASLAREYDHRRSQAGRLARRARHAREQLARDARDRETERDRLHDELATLREQLVSQDQLHERIAQLESTVRDGEAELERLRAERAALREQLDQDAHERGLEVERLQGELAALAHERDRRRRQAARLAQRSRHARARLAAEQELRVRIAQLETLVRDRNVAIDRLEGEPRGLRDALAGAEAAFSDQARRLEEQLDEGRNELAALVHDRDERRSQAARLAGRALHARAQLERETRNHSAEIDRLVGELGDLRGRLTDLTLEREERRDQAARLARRARQAREQVGDDERVARLESDVRGCDAEIARLRGELASAEGSVAEHERLLLQLREETDHRRAQAARFVARLRKRMPVEPSQAPAFDSHVVFIQLAGRYELLELAGPPPARNAVVDLPDLHGGPLVVAGLRRSPLPDDARPCIFVQPV